MASRGVFRKERYFIPIYRGFVVRDEGTDSNPPTTTVFVTDVNTTESWDDGDTGLVITGTGFV